MAKTTITVQEDTLERFKRIKQEADDAEPDLPDVNADHFVSSLLDTWERVGEEGYGDPGDPTTIDLDALEELLLAANDRDTTLTVGELVDELERTRELVESVPERTADELEGRFR